MVYKWSKTAAANASADSTINWQEGQAPSSINDSARAEMARVAQWRDDISGATVTTGTSTAYVVSSNQVFDTLAHLDGAMIAFTPHATSTGTMTLNVDGLGAKPLRPAPSVEFPSGSLVLGTPYVATYNNTDAVWYLQGGLSNPYNCPIGGGMFYFGSTAPNSAFVVPIGQAISRTTYAGLFTLFGTNFGAGDGSTTFNVPDMRGRVVAGYDAGNATGRLNTGGLNAASLGNAGGTQTVTLAASEIPAISATGATSTSFGGKSVALYLSPTGTTISASGTAASVYDLGGVSNISFATSASGTASTTSTNTGGGAHTNIQPTIVSNYILRVI